MKKLLRLLMLPCCLAVTVRAAELGESTGFDPSRFLGDRLETAARAPKLDPKRIINESNGFLKEREPEMTAEEYALYEKVVTMLGQNPGFAIKLLEAMMDEKERPSPAFEFMLGNAYYSAGQVEKSETRYRSTVERMPSFLRAWNNLGVVYYTSGRYAEAAPCFSKAIVLGDRDPTTFGLLGYSLEKEGDIVSAEMSYMQALAGAPNNPDWKEGLLRIFIEGKQLGRAESLVTSLIKEQPRQTRFWLTYANILLSDQRKLQATIVLEAAAGMGVAGTDELILLGDLYAEQKLVDEAIAIYERLLKPSPEMGESKLLHYAQVLIAGGKTAEAERVVAILGARPLSPAGQIGWRQARADLLMAAKRWADARAEIELLLQIAPMNGRALLTLGRAWAGEDDLPRALFAYEAAFRVPSATYRASLELANLELKNRHYDKSVEYLEKALSIEKTDAVADYLARVKLLAGLGG